MQLILGTVDNLIGTEGQGCIDNKHYKILDNVEPDTNVTAIIQRALGEVKYDLKNNYRLQG
jgi:hypothetical protein